MLDGHTQLAGLFAQPAAHSLSPAMYNLAFTQLGINAVYLAFDITKEALPQALDGMRAFNMLGANISMPHKQAVMPLLDEIAPEAALIKAVNTIENVNGRLIGHNTDGAGFMASLTSTGFEPVGKNLTLIGVGGAGTAIAIQAALDGMQAIQLFNLPDATWPNAVRVVDTINAKTPAHAELHELGDAAALQAALQTTAVFVDASAAGMGQLVDVSNFPDPTWLAPDTIIYDTVYAPRETKFLRQARAAGFTQCFNGLGMLLHQGALGFKLWTDQALPLAAIRTQIFGEQA